MPVVASAEQVVGPLVDEGDRPLYFGALLAVKNVTIIPYTMILLVGVARKPLVSGYPGRRGGRSPRRRPKRPARLSVGAGSVLAVSSIDWDSGERRGR
ncbi:hypothetical protein [Streptomyces sp. NPDC060194]|uniref:hypothetical protein n=1 Tax=Streptomyces sp. NPDC060194 TaxID=3347069 RepID=UPI00365DF3D1